MFFSCCILFFTIEAELERVLEGKEDVEMKYNQINDKLPERGKK